MKYDALGNVIERTWNEEITEAFEYDVAQRLVAATDGASEYRCEYDARSYPARESLTYAHRGRLLVTKASEAAP